MGSLKSVLGRFFGGIKLSDHRLFWTCVIYSLFHLALFGHAHLQNDYFIEGDRHYIVPYAFIVIHGIFLMLYATSKEFKRWTNGGGSSNRPGEMLVLAWILAICIMGLRQYGSKSQFKIPEGMVDMTVTMSLILLGTEVSKLFLLWKKPCNGNGNGKTPRGAPEPPPTEKPSP